MVHFLKTTKYAVKSPVADYRDNAYNAGIDGFMPSNTKEFREALSEKNKTLAFGEGNTSWFDVEKGVLHIAPQEDVLIPSGLYTKLDPMTMLYDANKSGVATKKKLAVGACVIDVSYQGIVHYHVYNFGKEWTSLTCDEKVCQMIQIPVLTGMTVEENIEPENWFEVKTDRGAGGFGSTGSV